MVTPTAHQSQPKGRRRLGARPLVDRLGADVALAGISVVLTDERGRVVERRVPDLIQEPQLDLLLLSPGYGWEYKLPKLAHRILVLMAVRASPPIGSWPRATPI